VLPLQTFLLPDDLSPFTSANWYGDGKVLLITFNAGWCIVCKKDTAVLNEWLATYEEDGLRVASILYENWNGAPVSQEYALFWQTNYETQYTMLMDQPDTDETGDAIGGALGVYLQPEGPVPNDTFPVTLLVCPATMKILYISSGFYDDVVHAGVMKWLYDQDCSDY
jgi:thiol-disulfide isomerase/thioredoxin